MSTESNNKNAYIPRATGLLVIEVMNSNPNGDPDQESDPRRRSHDQRGMITGVSFKRKLRDLVLRKDGEVWSTLSRALQIVQRDGAWSRDDYGFDILESRELKRADIKEMLECQFDVFKKRFWDGRVFGNTFLEEGVGNTIRSGVVQFALAVSAAPVRVHRLTKTKMAPAQEGTTRGMAPLAHRIVEHGVYTMPFFVNPTAAKGERGTGCTPLDISLLLRLIRYAYPHTKSDIRPLVEVRHAWYAEHKGNLGSFSEFEFFEALTPKRKEDAEKPSVSGVPMDQQYEVPTAMPDDFRGTLRQDKLYDLSVKLPEWCESMCEA